jgi:hypothetical protein
MKLNIPERIALLNVLPAEGSVVTLRVIMDLQKRIGFTEQDLKRFGIKNTARPDGIAFITWDPKMTNETKEIEIGEAGKTIIVEQLNRLNSQGRLPISMLPLYERFVETPEKPEKKS